MSPEGWPPYRVGNPEYLHALGVVASVFSLLELRLRSLFHLYYRLPTVIAYGLFEKNNNQERIKLVEEVLPYSCHPDTIRDHVTHFLEGYRVCVANRNILMHSVTAFVWLDPDADRCPVSNPAQPDGLTFQKWPRRNPLNISVYTPLLEELRAVADSMKAFEQYGDGLYWYVLQTCEPAAFRNFQFPADVQFPLPAKPEIPTKLVPSSLAPREEA
jgi:hypothetical protein